MRAFRFRLAPLQRLKTHAIEQEELILGSLRQEEQRLLDELQRGRDLLEARAERLLEETGQAHSAAMERDFDIFRSYMRQVEQQLLASIETCRGEQEACRQRLLKLYQESKTLERLETRAKESHRKAELREEGYVLDELGGQSHQRRRQAGSVSQKVIFVIAFIGTICLYFAHEKWDIPLVLEKAGIISLNRSPGGSSADSSSGSANDGEAIRRQPDHSLTVADMLAETDGSADRMLSDIRRMRRELDEWEDRLDEEEAIVLERDQTTEERRAEVERLIHESKDKVVAVKLEREKERERLVAEQEARYGEWSRMLGRMSMGSGTRRGAARLVQILWQGSGDGREIAMELYTRIPAFQRTKLMDSLGKYAPQVGAELAARFIELGGVADTAQAERTPAPQG